MNWKTAIVWAAALGAARSSRAPRVLLFAERPS